MNYWLTKTKRMLPETVRRRLRRRWDQLRFRGTAQFCPVCRSSVREFVPHGIPPRPYVRCPVCHSKACHRLAHEFFRKNPLLFKPDTTFLHIAPERELGCCLRSWTARSGMRYISGDLRDAAAFLDVRCLPFEKNSVCLIYCCHVLNMVDDDRLAMTELFRILDPAGVAILQVPIYRDRPCTVEVRRDSTEVDRLALFQDSAMYRKYSEPDCRARLNSAGFHVDVFRAEDCPSDDRSRFGLLDECLHVCRKDLMTVLS